MQASGIWAGRAVTGKRRRCREHRGFQTEGTMCSKTWKPKCVCWRTASNTVWLEDSDA